MDCDVPVDDYCDAWQSNNLPIPEDIPFTNNNSDQFFIALEVEITSPLMDEEDEEMEDEENPFIRVESTDLFHFWAPCKRTVEGNLSFDRISSMLSKAGLPRHKQEYMVDRIMSCADEIANAAYNKERRILPMMISISMIACKCYGETIEDPE